MIRLSVLALIATLSVAAQAAVSTFDTDDEGWRTCNFDFQTGLPDDFAPANWSATGGHPDGALLTEDVSDWNFLAAPAKFLGDQSAAYGSSLSYDTYSSQSDGLSYPAVVLTSGSVALYAVLRPPTAQWTPTAIPLLPSAWSVLPTGGGSVSSGLLRSVLKGLDGLYVEADWYGLGNETTGLDNVRLNPVPEPTPFSLLGLGAFGIVRKRLTLRRGAI